MSRAAEAWAPLRRDALRLGRRAAVLDGPHGGRAPLWPIVQVLWAACEVGALDVVDAIGDLLPRYRRGPAFAATPRGRRYHDDNAWLGLACLRAAEVTGDEAWRRSAVDLGSYVETGEHPRGGIRWREGDESRNACSTSSSAWLVLAADAPRAAANADRWLDWVDERLLRDDGLIADRIERGRVRRRAWTYNQGATIAAMRLRGRDPVPLARTTLAHWTPGRLWGEPPAFVAILARALLADPDPAVRRAATRWLDPYLARLTTEARDHDGWFVAGGVGSYDGHPTIDQAAVVQLFALRDRVQQP
ncbi:MAG TPA: glycoside hydrolase family 76 protein [Actinomycetota bacterium]